MFRILHYKNIYLIFIIAIVFFYILPSVFALFYGGEELAVELLALSLLSLFSYCFTYFLLSDFRVSAFYRGIPRINLSWNKFYIFVLFVYCFVIVYASFTAPKIPLIAALQGADMNSLAVLREEFLRTRVGMERILLFLYSIWIVAFIPMVIAQLYLSVHKYRHLVLLGFLISLALTLEKGRALVALLPLAVVFYNAKGAKKAAQVFLFLVVIIAAVSFLARGGLTSTDNVGTSAGGAEGVPEKYNLLKGDSQIDYLVNRIIYIPYVTAIDWLKYNDEVLFNESLGGRSIGLVAAILGEDKVYLEREVFAFQWGQNITGTGSANSSYFVDAYLNFGVLGVLFYTILLAAIVRACVLSKNKALIACLSISVYYVCMHGLPSVLFSGGFGFLFILSFFFNFKNSHAKEVGV